MLDHRDIVCGVSATSTSPARRKSNVADVACNCINDFGSAARPFNNNPYGAYYALNQESTGKSNYNALQTALAHQSMARSDLDRQLRLVALVGQLQ